MHLIIFFWILFIKFIEAAEPQNVKILFITDKTQNYVSSWTGAILKNLEEMHGRQVKFDDTFINIKPEEDESQVDEFCIIIASGVSVIIDLTMPDMFPTYLNKIMAFDIPYIKVDITIGSFVEAFDQYLQKRNATDAALIFASDSDLDQAITYLIGRSILRIIVIDANNIESLKNLAEMRPSPSYYAIFATTDGMRNIYNLALTSNLIYRYDRWNLIFFDYNYDTFLNTMTLNNSMSILYPKSEMACTLLLKQQPCDIPMNLNIFKEILNSFLNLFTNIVLRTDDEFNMKQYDCSIFMNDSASMDFMNNTKVMFYSQIMEEIKTAKSMFHFNERASLIQYNYEIGIKVMADDNKLQELANWNVESGVVLEPDAKIIETKAYYRIGTAMAIPWSFPVVDPDTGQVVLNEDGTEKWTGYCIDLIDIIAKEMNFDYEIVIPKKGDFGKKIGPDKWDGLVGDLKTGVTDMAVAALTMTAEREEVIDYVAPYFEQTGILIVMRKPVRQTSMFKFMTVLKMEVWLSILGALVVTAILLWILDTYSPYSARNNKKAYPYPCREFTLKESFWFALTSFTPQGGGEAPKAISGRTLVAAYWLFVVLMLATFTANLAAFLTVERMQTPVQSLEQLARQSRINYTVVEDSTTHEYFINMKKAEDTLYRLWKELTLNATSDQSQYRVWDYPIKEQYGHILSAIEETGTVSDASVGFAKVLERNEADFAFIHDSSQIKYEVSRNCNLTTIGDLFGEKPFAIAVQQGSHLQEELSKVILDLQKNRIFEHLTNKYWNYSARGVCSDSSDSEGISLESLGGVFIATLFGLALAMITLAGEVIYYKRKERNEVRAMMEENMKPKPPKSPKLVTIGKTFKPVGDKLPRVSHISVFPRNTFQP